MNKLINSLKSRNSKLFQCAVFIKRKLPVPFQRLMGCNCGKNIYSCNSIVYGGGVFANIYKINHWGSQESKSGQGSTMEATAVIRKQLPLIIEKYAIQSMVDTPCGDYNWMRTVEKTCSYIGGDIVAEIVENNQKLYSSKEVQFKLIDITMDALPKVDLIFCRDCLQHLSYANVRKALCNFKSSGSKYLLVTSYPKTWINYDIKDGGYRALNLRKSPFRLPKPLLEVRESHGFVAGVEIDKTMYLYKLSDLSE